MLTAAVSQQVESVREGISQQSQATVDAVQGQIAVLSEVVERNGKQLDTGTGELLGNLRAGLERMAELLVEALQKHGENADQGRARNSRARTGVTWAKWRPPSARRWSCPPTARRS